MVNVHFGALWRHPGFRLAWAGMTISSIGGQVTLLAMPLTAVLVFGAGPAQTGLLTAAGAAPTLLLGLVAGAWVDRLPRRRVRITADLCSACVVASVPTAALLGVLRLEHLYVATFLAGCCSIWSRLASSALLPTLVGREHLLEANTKLMTSFSLALLVGPSLAGVLVQVLSAPLALLVDAASFLVSAACYGRIRLVEPARGAEQRAGLGTEILEGLGWLRGEPILFRLTVSIGLANLAWYGVQAVVVVYATDDLHLEPTQLGLALASIGPTGLVGALIAAACARRFGLGPTMLGALCGEALSRVVLVVAGGPPPLAALAIGASQALFGFIAPLWDVNANSLRQAATPARLLGRVSAASSFVGVGAAPLGAVLAGWLGQLFGARVALLETALVTVLAVLVLVWSPVPRLREPAAATPLTTA